MVVIDASATLAAGVMHERRATPLISTVQAPHWAIPQPNLVPLSSSPSRSAQSSGMSSGASSVLTCPLTFSRSFIASASLEGAVVVLAPSGREFKQMPKVGREWLRPCHDSRAGRLLADSREGAVLVRTG